MPTRSRKGALHGPVSEKLKELKRGSKKAWIETGTGNHSAPLPYRLAVLHIHTTGALRQMCVSETHAHPCLGLPQRVCQCLCFFIDELCV